MQVRNINIPTQIREIIYLPNNTHLFVLPEVSRYLYLNRKHRNKILTPFVVSFVQTNER